MEERTVKPIVKIEINRQSLAMALRVWEAEAKAGNWPLRSADPGRFYDEADYLFNIMGAGSIPR